MPSFPRETLVDAVGALARQERRVRFQDVDAAGTIYYARAFEYFGDVYLDLLANAGLDVPGMLQRRELAAPLIHAEADYLAPLRFGDDVRVELVKAEVGTSSTTYGYRITKSGGEVAAIGETRHVWVDGKTFRPTPVPDMLRRHVEKISFSR
jgi:YbgC/YbaW family acyl-CoA thioester hydrolase